MFTLSALVLLFTGCSNTLKGDAIKDAEPPPGDTGDTDLTPPTPEVPTPPPPPPPPADDDGDGWTADDDCDDASPTSFPGAPELCDGMDNNCDGVTPVEEQDLDGDGVIDCAEVAVCVPPVASPIPVLADCEYEPNIAGTPFHARIEWSMSHAMVDPGTGLAVPAYEYLEFPTYHDAMHSPSVFQATDDDGDGTVGQEDVPDIAVVMGVEDGIPDGVLRLISGDGEGVHDSVHWEGHVNANGSHQYAPYHYAGVAMGNIDGDSAIEIVTLAIRESDGLCFPAVYEVDGTLNNVTISLDRVYGGGNFQCAGHAPALHDLDGDGSVEVVLGRSALTSDLAPLWLGTGGRGWYHQVVYADGYWNSGAHSFGYDLDGDGAHMEVVAGSTIYTHDGDVYCELGTYDGATWVPALDGYPAVADVARFAGDIEGEPEIVVTGNEQVALYHGVPDYDPLGLARCLLIDELPNAPEDDASIVSLPSNPNCLDRPARGGPPTIADFDGDGTKEVAVAGSCWYSVYRVEPTGVMLRYALAQTLDYSSASTGSTVFDFNGDGASEVVFSDEEALYVWSVDTAAGLEPWERLVPLLVDENHKSWTIHEYPLVADVDADGKAEIVSVNASNPTWADRYGIYVLGSADDDWVTARQSWNQHAYYVTNLGVDDTIGYGPPNYAPFTAADHNDFRNQMSGEYGALQASNAFPQVAVCQETCGEIELYVQLGNNGPHVSIAPSVAVSVYGVLGGSRVLLESEPVDAYVHPGALSDGMVFDVPDWAIYDNLVISVDDPAYGPLGSAGQANECDESDNEVVISLGSLCP